MSAPFIWILLPIPISMVLYALRRFENWVKAAAFLIAILLAALTIILPADLSSPIHLGLGLPPFVIKDSSPILSARLQITQENRPVIGLFYLALSIWFGCAATVSANRMLFPVGLGSAGFLAAALSITPSLYAPLLVGIVILICIPILTEPCQALNKGIRQYLTFQILGMCLILLANWSILYSDVQELSMTDLQTPLMILGVGYALILPVYPFHSWIPAVAGNSKPLSPQLVLFLVPVTNLLLLNDRLQLIDLSEIAVNSIFIIKVIAILMIGGSGLWAVLEKNLGRLSGFMIIQQIGTLLFTIGLALAEKPDPANVDLLKSQLPPFGIAFALYAYSLAILQNDQVGLSQKDTIGVFQKYPIAASGIFLAIYSLSGFPPLAGFPFHHLIWSRPDTLPPALALIALFGRLGLAFSGLRFFSNSLVFDSASELRINERKGQIFILIFGMTSLIIMGLFSNASLSILGNYFNPTLNPLP